MTTSICVAGVNAGGGVPLHTHHTYSEIVASPHNRHSGPPPNSWQCDGERDERGRP